MRKLLILSLLMAISFGSFAQTALATPMETATRTFFKALQENNTEVLKGFVATKTTYLEIAAAYAFDDEQKRQKAVARIETNYEQQAATIAKSFETVQARITAAGINLKDCSIGAVRMRESEKGGLKGGRGTLMITDAAQHEITLNIGGLYEFKGKWYIMDELKLREAKQ